MATKKTLELQKEIPSERIIFMVGMPNFNRLNQKEIKGFNRGNTRNKPNRTKNPMWRKHWDSVNGFQKLTSR